MHPTLGFVVRGFTSKKRSTKQSHVCRVVARTTIERLEIKARSVVKPKRSYSLTHYLSQ